MMDVAETGHLMTFFLGRVLADGSTALWPALLLLTEVEGGSTMHSSEDGRVCCCPFVLDPPLLLAR